MLFVIVVISIIKFHRIFKILFILVKNLLILANLKSICIYLLKEKKSQESIFTSIFQMLFEYENKQLYIPKFLIKFFEK